MRMSLVVAAILASCASHDGTEPLPPSAPPPPPPPAAPRLALQPVVSGLAFPVLLTSPVGDSRLFIVEKGGRIRIVKGGSLVAQPFLDISTKVSNGSEQGLLGLAFHPRYATNGIFVVNYTDGSGDTQIATYHVSSDPDRADAASERVVLAIDQPYSNHNGGNVVFGPDGMLYVGMGDGGSGGDPQGHGQNKNDLLGSTLRLAIADNGTMTVPPDNPYVGQSGARPELWDIGLRNPWRFSFDRATGDLYIADVGQSALEEVNVATAASGRGKGRNYGWNAYEGTACYGSASRCTGTGFTMPVIEYSHSNGCSITGGFVYRGAAIPDLRGTYFYGEYCNGWVRSFKLASGSATEQTTWTTLAPGGSITSFGEDSAGEIYVMTQQGGVWRIVAAP